MNAVRRVAKNTTVLFTSQIISYTISFFIVIYVANYLGPLGWGIINTAIAFTAIFSVLTDFGLGTLIVRDVSRDKSFTNKYLSNIIVMRIILALVTLFLVFLAVSIINYPKEEIYVIYIITFSVIVTSFSSLFYSVLQAHQDMVFQSFTGVLNSILMLVGVIFVIYYHLDVLAYASLYLISNAIILIYTLIFYLKRFQLPKFEFDYNFWKTAIITALPLSLTSIFILIAFRVDIVILSIFKPSADVGFYSAAYRLMEFLLFIPGVFSTAIFPAYSRLYISSEDSLKYSYQKSFKYLTILSLPIAVGITLLAPQIILFIYPKYTPSIFVLQILIWAIPIIFLNYIFGTIIPAMNRQNSLAKITFISMAVNIPLNLIFIPIYSYIGAAVITVITELVIFSLCFYILSRTFHKIRLLNYLIKPALASIVMSLFIINIKLNLFIEIFIAAIIYFAAIVLMKTFTEEDYAIFKQVINFKKD